MHIKLFYYVIGYCQSLYYAQKTAITLTDKLSGNFQASAGVGVFGNFC